MNRNSITFKILQAVSTASVESLHLCEAIVEAGYGASSAEIRRLINEKREGAKSRTPEIVLVREHVRKYQKLISKLKHDGLVSTRTEGGKRFFSLTSRGKNAYQTLRKRNLCHLPPIEYPKIPGTQLIIVAFDVPQKERRKRDWLREVLKSLDLKMVQKSLWMGKVKIPEEFLNDIYALNLTKCVEIFQVGKTGSLRPLV